MVQLRNCWSALCALAIVSFWTLAGDAPTMPKASPSANKGKPGNYECRTSHPGYDYWVGVPKTYSDSNPAGILLFFHGQGGAGAAKGMLGTWSTHILEPFNVIAVDMQYQDGDNAKDTPGKVAAAREALAQTTADYKIVAGRGVICSFSGGGLPHGLFFMQSAKTRGREWPFCHMGMYSSNFRVGVPGKAPLMNWFFSVGQKEWSLANLGTDATGHMIDLLGAAAKGGVPDLRLKIMKGKGHSIDKEEVAECIKGFRRSDLSLAPFVYEPDYEGSLASIARQANSLALGPAASSLDSLINAKSTQEEVKKKAAALRELITKRAAAIVQLAKELAEEDALLGSYYAPSFTQQLSGLAESKELQQVLSKATALKDCGRVQALCGPFKEQLRSMITGNGTLNPSAVPLLEQIQKVAGEKSQFGGMAAEFLLLK